MRTLPHLILSGIAITGFVSFALVALLPTGSPWLYRLLAVSFIAVAAFFARDWISSIWKGKDERSHRPAFLIAGAIGLLYVLIHSILFPIGMDDAWLLWNLKGKHIGLSFLEGREFIPVREEWDHSNYPLFLPFALSFWVILSNTWSVLIPIAIDVLLYLCLILLVYDIVRDLPEPKSPFAFLWPRHRGGFGEMMGVAILLCPGVIVAAPHQCADFPIAVMVVAIFHASFQLRKGGNLNQVLLIAMYIAALAHIKNEGTLIAIILSIYLMVVHRDLLRRLRSPRMIGSAVLILTSAVFLFLFKAHASELQPYDVTSEESLAAIFEPVRYGKILGALVLFLVVGGLLLHFSSFVSAWLYHRSSIWHFAPLAAVLFVYHAFYVVTPVGLEWHLVSSYPRLMLHVLPAWVFVGIFAISEGSDRSASRASQVG